MPTICRTATASDEPAVLEVMSLAFGRKRGSARYAQDAVRFRAHPADHQVLTVDGDVVAALHIHRHEIQIVSCIATKADVGEVSVHPDYQGRGLGTRLIPELQHRVDESVLEAIFPPQLTATGI